MVLYVSRVSVVNQCNSFIIFLTSLVLLLTLRVKVHQWLWRKHKVLPNVFSSNSSHTKEKSTQAIGWSS